MSSNNINSAQSVKESHDNTSSLSFSVNNPNVIVNYFLITGQDLLIPDLIGDDLTINRQILDRELSVGSMESGMLYVRFIS